MTSRAHELYHQILATEDSAQLLKDMITSQRTETEFLEFKGAGRIEPKQIKAFWSRTLSGFANTEGGVLIWGIRAARVEHPDDPSRKIDVASELDLVPTTTTFAQLLKDVLLEACVEPAQGIRIEEIDAGEGNGSGFVVCYIPEGSHKPYRAELESSRQYWQRIGDNFAVIPHSLLRSLFHPSFSPLLCIRMWPSRLPFDEPVERLPFLTHVENVGTASAREAYVTCHGVRHDFIQWGPAWEPRRGATEHSTGMRCLHTLHPKETIEIGTIAIPRSGWEGSQPTIAGGLQCSFTIYLADHAPQAISVEFTPFEIAYNQPVKKFYPDDTP